MVYSALLGVFNGPGSVATGRERVASWLLINGEPGANPPGASYIIMFPGLGIHFCQGRRDGNDDGRHLRNCNGDKAEIFFRGSLCHNEPGNSRSARPGFGLHRRAGGGAFRGLGGGSWPLHLHLVHRLTLARLGLDGGVVLLALQRSIPRNRQGNRPDIVFPGIIGHRTRSGAGSRIRHGIRNRDQDDLFSVIGSGSASGQPLAAQGRPCYNGVREIPPWGPP